MTTVHAYAAPHEAAPLERTTIERRELGPHDILIDIAFADGSNIRVVDVINNRIPERPGPFGLTGTTRGAVSSAHTTSPLVGSYVATGER